MVLYRRDSAVPDSALWLKRHTEPTVHSMASGDLIFFSLLLGVLSVAAVAGAIENFYHRRAKKVVLFLLLLIPLAVGVVLTWGGARSELHKEKASVRQEMASFTNRVVAAETAIKKRYGHYSDNAVDFSTVAPALANEVFSENERGSYTVNIEVGSLSGNCVITVIGDYGLLNWSRTSITRSLA